MLPCNAVIGVESTTLTSQSGFTLSGRIELGSAGRLHIVCVDLDILDGGIIDASEAGEASDVTIADGAGGERSFHV